ncbi:hypothetical protein CAPTEDRAFT_202452 [Capitella teleta]|uniref:Uncharacterized protein n=1 Tax=Capitella teleta TaxID=283909 RepID=R7TKU9_CAPTE|nr:hypothetical protein CAPTEDRAFT_202452 [Capitella teleta]|eukprot:ELT91730.1 hypothetical protein CAPTEDRAFT_202452 [Capitella teleta]
MFLKPFKVRSQTLIKGSDRKKLRAELSKQFPSVSADVFSSIVPNKEEMSLMKITAHSRESIQVYCVQKNPVIFELNQQLFPTVYTLWNYPELLLVFTTWPPVFKKIVGGADLMLPGVILTEQPSPKMFNGVGKDTACCIKLLGNKAPVAVGRTAMCAEDMYMSALRGKGVTVIHSYQDLLWAVGDKSDPPLIDDTEMLEIVKNRRGEEEIVESMASVNLQDGTEGEASEAVEDETEVDPRSLQEIQDELLEKTFLFALKSQLKAANLPILTSKFFKTCMLPLCPPGQNIDVKKSSYKKLGKFLQSMQERGMIRVKELSKGVESIVSFDKDHDDVRAVKAVDVPKPEVSAVAEGEVFHPPVIEEVFVVSACTAPLFRTSGFSKGDPLLPAQVRQVITEYVRANNLKNPNSRGQVTLDPLLCDALIHKSEYMETISWEEITNRCLSKMNPGFQVSVGGAPPVLKKGKVEPIVLNVAQRGGNKKVYPAELAHFVQKGVACSTSVNPLPGKSKGMEVLVQGNQINFVSKLLCEKYQVPKKFLSGLEKAVKSKKR